MPTWTLSAVLLLMLSSTVAVPPIVYTYFEPASAKGRPTEAQAAALALWKTTWAAAGFAPRVLRERHARKHPRFAEFVALYYMLPTANPKHYEVSCYLRYLALASMGGGWMVDYDVLPLSPSPPSLQLPDEFTVYDGQTPSMVAGTAKQFAEVAEYMAYYNFSARPTYAHGQPSTSDMLIIQRMVKMKLVASLGCVISALPVRGCGATANAYGLSPRCEGAPLAVHFSHHAVNSFLGREAVPFEPARMQVVTQFFAERRRRCGTGDAADTAAA